jgi:hypothetical protein
LLAIEEDFASTRKIAKARIASRRDLIQALAPLLSVQNGIGIGIQDAPPNPTERFRDWPKAALEALSGGSQSDDEGQMKISKIEIEGFRGIRERVSISLPSGFVVIVGRNGAGNQLSDSGRCAQTVEPQGRRRAKSQVYVHPGRGAACAPWF